MKKLLTVLSIAALCAPTLAFATAGDVSMTTSAVFDVGGIEVDVSGSAVSVSSVVVSNTSIAFTLASGDTFTISAPLLNRLYTDTGTGLTSDNCSAAHSILTYEGPSSGTVTVTVTPSATVLCADPTTGSQGSSSGSSSSSGGGGGGGGGGSIAITPPVASATTTSPTATTTPTVSSTPTITTTTTPPASGLSDLQINAILSLLTSFGADDATIANVQATLNGVTTGSVTSAAVHVFKTNLQLGSLGNEVKALQQYLNAHGYPVTANGAGSPGNETTKFGPATKAALIKFQKANNITPAVGYFGPKTQAVVNVNQ